MTTPRAARRHLSVRSLLSIILIVGYGLYALFITARWIHETIVLAYQIGQG